MTWGAAKSIGIINAGLRTPSWAPANNLIPTTISGSWIFNPACMDAMPQPRSTGVFRTNSFTDQTLQRVEQCLFSLPDGSLLCDLNPGSGAGTATAVGVNFWGGRLMFTGSGLANFLYTNAMNFGLPELTPSFNKSAMFQLANSLLFLGQPITYKDNLGDLTLGQLYGVGGTDQYIVSNPFLLTQKIAIDTTPTGGGNPNFFGVGTWSCNTCNPLDDTDFVNRLYVSKNAFNNGPWVFFWQDGVVFDQLLLKPTMADNPTLDALLQAGAANLYVNAWPGGFVVGFPTGGTGPTKQPYEWALMDWNWENYLLLNFIPMDNQAAIEIGRGINTVTVDTNGTIWAGDQSGFDSLYPLYVGKYWPLTTPVQTPPIPPPFDLPCFNPCTTIP